MHAVLHADGLTRHYRVSRGLLRAHATVKALNGVSFTLQAGRTLAVVGESGCGKSTLARQLTLIEPPTAGALRIDGVDVAQADKATLQRLRQRVQMVFQNPYASLNPRKSIAAALEEPLLINTRLSKPERRERIAQMLDRVGLRPEHVRAHRTGDGIPATIATTMVMGREVRVVCALPTGEQMVVLQGRGVDPELEQAARGLGAGPATTFGRITLPLVAPGLLAGATLVFLSTMKELPATLIIRPFDFDTLAVRVELKESALSLSHQQRCDICHQLRHHIKSIVGVSTDVSIANCGDIPRSEGKAQRVVDLRPR